jgi:hypothetical protein
MSPSAPPPTNAPIADKIKWFYEGYPDITKFVTEPPKDTDAQALDKDVEKLKVRDETKEEKIEGLQKDFLYIGGPEVLLRRTTTEKKEQQEQQQKQDASSSS